MSAKPPILNQINVVAKDLRASMAFYRRLGVSFRDGDQTGDPFHANGESGDQVALDLDSSDFAQIWNKGWAGRRDLVGRTVLGFALDSREAVDRTYAELTDAGHRGLQPPCDAFWGARYAIVEDPDGVAVGLMSPIDPAKRSWPPEGWNR